MNFRLVFACALMLSVAGCTSGNLNHALGSPKNPNPIFVAPGTPGLNSAGEIAFLQEKYRVLMLPAENPMLFPVPEEQMRPYISNGLLVAEYYCAKFLNKTDEASRRRRFGRSTVNDVGTVMQGLLNLAKAGADVVTGVGIATGLSDSLWRNYDTAFLISPELGNVKSLVRANMKNYRAQLLGPGVKLPSDWGTAQSAILEYADMCSYTGLQDLLSRSTRDLQQKLNEGTRAKTGQGATPLPITENAPPEQPAQAVQPMDADPPPVSNERAAEQPPPDQLSAAAVPIDFVARWGTAGDRAQWSATLLQAVAELGRDLTNADFIPVDIGEYCPAYGNLDSAKRGHVWAGLISVLARPESDFNPAVEFEEKDILDAAGNPVISRGLLQISQESANGYGCGITDPQQLHDPTTNLRCGVRIINRLVSRDGVVAERDGNKWRGAAAYWSPFRIEEGRTEMGTWLSEQSYCA